VADGYGTASALEALVGGAQAGQSQQREFERRARQDLLQQRLLEAQINELGAQAWQRRQTPKPRAGEIGKYTAHVNEDGTVDYIWQPGVGEAPPTAPPPQQPSGTTPPTKGTPLPRPGRPPVVHSGTRVGPKPNRPLVSYDPKGGLVLVTPGRAGAPATTETVGGGAGQRVTPQERVAGSQTATVEDAATRMERISRQHPDAFQAAVGFIRASHHGPVGRLVNEARGVLSDPAAVEAVQAYQTYLLGISPTYGGARPTKQLLELEQEASLPPFGASRAVWPQAFAAMRSRINDLRAKAGRSAPAPAAPFQFKYHTPK
jgi:hypothetical protein